ncbi:MAG: DNA mismatch repair endonuclease MutL [Lentisphaeria bacterium]|nr:DNA mismatch repair endonuclease MutL [Lentisphaeria bacterium]
MSRIKVMDRALANLIAAGEVIERPASVVKELIENALDAGSTRIAVKVERAGSRLISVTDDGCGMDSEDARTALELHGTSKLFAPDGISAIATMGFRGEALPSIAQVSRLTLRTREKGSPEGVEITVEGGKILNTVPCGAPPGSSFKVENLFFNTPARKKFLKSPGTEEGHIQEAVTLLALANPGVGFELDLDGRSVFNLPRGTMEERMRGVFGRQYCAGLLAVDHREGPLHVSGFIGIPGFTRSSRREQRFFVNRRPVDSVTMGRALRDGYATLAEPGRYPPAVLFLELPVDEVDVNVHPAKREIRFRSEFAVIRAVAAAVSSALRKWGAGGPELPEEEPELPEESDAAEPTPELPGVSDVSGASGPAAGMDGLLSSADVEYHVEPKNEQGELSFEEGGPFRALADTPLEHPRECSYDPDEAPAGTPAERAAEPPARETAAGFWPERILGIYDDTYLLAAGPDGLLLIDQHAAHERVMFERLLDSWRGQGGEVPAQGLLIPETLELPRGLLMLLERNLAFFRELGFDFTPAGGFSVIVNALPAGLRSSRPLGELVSDMLSGLLDENYTPGDLTAVARAACHAAVKAHDALTVEGAEELLRSLRRCRQGTLCPHGRPTMITLTRREIEKRFGRR